MINEAERLQRDIRYIRLQKEIHTALINGDMHEYMRLFDEQDDLLAKDYPKLFSSHLKSRGL